MEGLRRNDPGRLLHARFGCSWGLARVMCVHKGVLLTSDNSLLYQVVDAVGKDTLWSLLCEQVFGVTELS